MQIQKNNISLESIVLGLWILNLFKPDWILAYYVPEMAFVKAAPTILLYPALMYLLFSGRRIVLDKPYIFFFMATLISTMFAYNTGISRLILRSVSESLILFILSISVIQDEKCMGRLINLYLLSFVFYGVCGIAWGGLVPFHISMNNEDAFGPFMAMGVPMAFFVSHQWGTVRYREIGVSVLCVIGVISSFAKGAFLSLCTGIAYIAIRYQRKITAISIIIIMLAMILVSASILFEGKYWDEMSTIFDAHKEEVGVGDTGRQYLWKQGWEMFIDHPVLGVGPRNYGYVLPRITTINQLDRYGYTYSYIYGRVPHNIYVQLMAEMGIAGIISFIIIIISFFNRNMIIRASYYELKRNETIKKYNNVLSSSITRNYYLATAIQGSLIVYLINGLFYDLLYFHWFTDLLILNSIVLQISKKNVIHEVS